MFLSTTSVTYNRMARGCTDKRHHTTAYACFYVVGVALLSCDVKKLLYDNASNSKFPKGDILNGVSDYCINLRWPTTVTTKPKTSRQKQNTSRQNQKPHDKTKDLTAKANTQGKTKAILLLLWSIWFCREVFDFAVRYFVFAVRFLVLLWQLWATIINSLQGAKRVYRTQYGSCYGDKDKCEI